MNKDGKKRLQAGLSQVNAFFSWWKSELSEMAPAFTGQKAQSAENLLLAMFKEDRVTFFWRESSHWRELGHGSVDSTLHEIGSQFDFIRNEKYTTIARLPAASILRRRLNLPIAAENELHQILSYQLDSLSPYPSDQVYMSHRILERLYTERKIEVELYLAPKDEVDQRVNAMRSWDLVPDFVDFVDQDELAEPVVNLLPNPLTPINQRRLFSPFNKLLLAINALLAILLVSAVITTRANMEEELKTRVETAKLKADAAIRLRDKVEKLSSESSFLQDTKKQRTPVLELIDELSGILPDGTWLEKAVYRTHEISLSGISSKASVLIAEIERSPLFESAAFQASVVQDDRSGGERFQIKADISKVEQSAE